MSNKNLNSGFWLSEKIKKSQNITEKKSLENKNAYNRNKKNAKIFFIYSQ